MGLANSRLYKIWINMKSRCYNPKVPAYKNYGGRGITVCDEWVNDFNQFKRWAEKTGYTDTLTIERIDVNKAYAPDNCKWIDKADQPKNRRNTVIVEGKTLTQIAELSGVPYPEVKSRYYRGAKTIKELSKPLKKAVKVAGKTLKEISEETGIKYATLKVRYRNGCRDYKSLTRKEYERYGIS